METKWEIPKFNREAIYYYWEEYMKKYRQQNIDFCSVNKVLSFIMFSVI